MLPRRAGRAVQVRPGRRASLVQRVRQRQAAILDALQAGMLANEAAGRRARAIARSEAGMKRGPSHQHWPSRLVHVH